MRYNSVDLEPMTESPLKEIKDKKSKVDVNFPSTSLNRPYSNLLGLNISVGNGTSIKNKKGTDGNSSPDKKISEVFTSLRFFHPCNKDFFYSDEGFTGIPPNCSPKELRSRTKQIPNGNVFIKVGNKNKSNLRLLINKDNKTTSDNNANFPNKSFIIPIKIVIPGSNGTKVLLMEQPTTEYLTTNCNIDPPYTITCPISTNVNNCPPYIPSGYYMNRNYLTIRPAWEEFNQKPQTLTLALVKDNFDMPNQDEYSFPYAWFRQDENHQDWGEQAEDIIDNAKGYAKMLCRTYSPKIPTTIEQRTMPEYCETCPQLIDVIEIGNEPWAFYQDIMYNGTMINPYHLVVKGFVDGINEYYGLENERKIKLLPAAFQARLSEGTNPVPNFESLRDCIDDKVPEFAKCDLIGTNIHPYSNLTFYNTLADKKLFIDNPFLTAYPEKIVTQADNVGKAGTNFLRIKNAWQWMRDNPMKKSDLYVSEYGWDSEKCNGSDGAKPGVGNLTQGIYTLRALLMMGRYGVKQASLYQDFDDQNIFLNCSFAHHRGGVFGPYNGNSKEIFKFLDKFRNKVGNLSFNYAVKEEDNGTFAYILEKNGIPTHMVAWRAVDINDYENTMTLDAIINKTTGTTNGPNQQTTLIIPKNDDKTFIADKSKPWFQLDNLSYTPINSDDYNPAGTNLFKISPVPILIPIKEGNLSNCNINGINGINKSINGTVEIEANFPRYSDHDITIETGGELLVNGTLNMEADTKIYLNESAKITFGKNGHITSCSGTWDGIENTNSNAIVTMNGGKISNAKIGIFNILDKFKVEANGALFFNNLIDISNANNNSAFNFTDCTFTLYDNYAKMIFSPRISLTNSTNNKFLGCRVENLNYSIPNSVIPIGIQAVSSKFDVDEINRKRGVFDNFAAGILTYSTGVQHLFTLQHSDFNKNVHGLVSYGVNKMDIQHNKFNVTWGLGQLNSNWFKSGISLFGCTGYTLQNNEFEGIGNDAKEYTFGIVVENGGTSNNLFEGNNYKNMYAGVRAIGENGLDLMNPAKSGLQLFCNDHNNGVWDHTVEYGSNKIAAIRGEQGSPNKGLGIDGFTDGNKFSQNNPPYDIDAEGDGYTRYKDPLLPKSFGFVLPTSMNIIQNNLSEDDKCNYFTPFTTKNVSLIESGKDGFDPTIVAALTERYNQYNPLYQNAKNSLTTLMDEGNHSVFINKIKNDWSGNPTVLSSKLIDNSPFVSPYALLEATKLHILDKSSLIEIYKLNPNSTANISFVRNVNEILPNYLTLEDKEGILNTPKPTDLRTELENEMNGANIFRSEIVNKIVQEFASDSILHTEELRYWWSEIGDLSALYQIAETYISSPESNSYIELMQNRNLEDKLSSEQIKNNNDYIALYIIRSKVLKSGRSILNLNANEINEIRYIAYNSRYLASIMAQNILCASIGDCKLLDVPPMPNHTGILAEKQNIQIANHKQNLLSNDYIKVYPNPTVDIANISYNIATVLNDAYLLISDITGKVFRKININNAEGTINIETSNMNSSIYIVKLMNNNLIINQTKLTIIK
jgi:hypothetical protein